MEKQIVKKCKQVVSLGMTYDYEYEYVMGYITCAITFVHGKVRKELIDLRLAFASFMKSTCEEHGFI